jgi:hypothetical protein
MAAKEDANVPGPWAQVRWAVDAGPLDVSVLRDSVSATVRSWGMDALADDVARVVAELTANAWMVQLPVVVTLRLEESAIVTEVTDSGPGVALFAAHDDPFGIDGRGLTAVASLVHELGLYACSTSRTVWARLYFRWAAPPEEGTAA